MTPKIVPDLYEMIYCKIGKSGRATGKKAMIWECANDVTIDSIIDLSHLMLAINSSVNVIIYTLRGKKHSFFEKPKYCNIKVPILSFLGHFCHHFWVGATANQQQPTQK